MVSKGLSGYSDLVNDSNESECLTKLNLAFEVKKSWANLSWQERADCIKKFLSLLESNQEQFHQILWDEMKKPETLARNEFTSAVRFAKFIIDNSTFEHQYSVESAVKGKEILISRVPFGVILAITSFNTPLPNYMWKVAPSLIVGNVVILKPSPVSSISARLFVDLWAHANPDFSGALQLIFGGEKQVNTLIKSVEAISFTGSTKVGRTILRSAAERNLPVIAELGGCNPFIVDESADLLLAVKSAVQSSFSNGGQRCASASRYYIHHSIFEDFWNAFNREAQQWISAPQEKSEYAPLCPENRASDFKQAVESLSKFARRNKVFPVPAWASNLQGAVNPQVLEFEEISDPNLELFGPIAMMQQVASIVEAVEFANKSEFGLTAAFWSADESNIEFALRSIKAGLLNINGPTMGAEPIFPFGGFGASGNGTRETGVESLNQYSTTRVTTRISHVK